MGVDFDIVIGGFEVVDVFERDDLDLTTCLDDDTLLLGGRLGGGFEQGFGAACGSGGIGTCGRALIYPFTEGLVEAVFAEGF